MFSEDVDALKAKRMCFSCVGEEYLSDEIRAKGKRAKCNYCGKTRRSYSLDDVAERVETAFEQHYVRTSDQPDDYQSMLSRDRESRYEWYRGGEPVTDAIMAVTEISQEVAEDIQKILEDEHADLELAQMGEETEFDEDSYYEEKGPSDEFWQEEWDNFENSLKTEARFFSRTAASRLKSIFEGIDELRTRDDRHLVVDGGPGTDFHTLYRARVFQSDDKLEAALCRPDAHLGSPPGLLAAAGRMNARGISVFYGTNDQKAAIAEVRPPVGSQVAVARFELIRKVRLLDLTALSDVSITGSIFDFTLVGRRERAVFLRSLGVRITRPVMPDDEPFEYLTTQAVADFLATESLVPIDGIIFPSVQAAGNVLNVALFHKAARVEALDVPKGTEISATTGHWEEEGWENEYVVIEKVPPATEKSDKKPENSGWPDFTGIMEATPLYPPDADSREASLRIVQDSIEVHRVKRVEFETEEFKVRRHRGEKRDFNL